MNIMILTLLSTRQKRCILLITTIVVLVILMTTFIVHQDADLSLRGQLTNIGVKGGRTVTNITFDHGEISEMIPVDHLGIALIPNEQDISDGATLSTALSSGKRIFGYKYTSLDAATEIAAKLQADNGKPLTYSELFPGQFFVSDEERIASGSIVTRFEQEKNITFLPLSAVTLERNARYVIITMDDNVALTVRGLEWCGDGVFTNTSGIEWMQRNAVNADWVQVAYGNGLFVALSKFGGDIMFSPDGMNWTRYGQNEGSYFSGLTYGNGLFVAVSTVTGVMTSPDGLTWTKREINSENSSWNSIAYGNGMFVAVSTRGYVMSSNNGMNWIVQKTDGVWRDVAYGNGVFIAVDGDNNEVLTSSNGSTWTRRKIDDGINRFWGNITYGNNIFVVTSYSGKIATSSDGIVWIVHPFNHMDTDFVDVVHGKGAFVGITSEVAAGGGGEIQRSITSLDGITWTKGEQLYNGFTWADGKDLYGNLRSIAYGNGLFVAVGKFDSVMLSGKYGFFGNDINNEHSEQCDDGNTIDDDACSNACTLPL